MDVRNMLSTKDRVSSTSSTGTTTQRNVATEMLPRKIRQDDTTNFHKHNVVTAKMTPTDIYRQT